MNPQNPKRYFEVQQEFEDWKIKYPQGAEVVTLEDFAKGMDHREFSSQRAAAYNPDWLKNASGSADQLGTPASDKTSQFGGFVGRGLDKVFDLDGVGEQVLSEIGRDLPRDLIETGIMALVPGGQLKGAATTAKYGKRLAQLGAGLSAGTRVYTDTDNIGAGAAIGATLPLADELMPLISRAAVEFVNPAIKRTKNLVESGAGAGRIASSAAEVAGSSQLRTTLAGATAEAATAVGVNELGRQGMMSAMGIGLDDPNRNPLTVENILAQGVGGAMQFSPQLARGLITNRRFNVDANNILKDYAISRAKGSQNPVADMIRGTSWEPEFLSHALTKSKALQGEAREQYLSYIFDALETGREATAASGEANETLNEYKLTPPETTQDAVDRLVTLQRLRKDVISEFDARNEAANRQFGDDTPLDRKGRDLRKEVPGRTTSSANVKDLWEKGFLPEIDERWVAKQLGEDYGKLTSDSDANAWDVVIQKVTNQLTMLLETAESNRRENTFVREFGSEQRVKEKESFRKMVQALDALDEQEALSGPIMFDGDPENPVRLQDALLAEWVGFLRKPEDVDSRIKAVPFVDDISEIVLRLKGKPGVDYLNDRIGLTKQVSESKGMYDPNDVEGRTAATIADLDGKAPKTEIRPVREIQRSLRDYLGSGPGSAKARATKGFQRDLTNSKGLVKTETDLTAEGATPFLDRFSDTDTDAGLDVQVMREFGLLEDGDATPITSAADVPVEANNRYVEMVGRLRDWLDVQTEDTLWVNFADFFGPKSRNAKKPLLKKAIDALLEAGPTFSKSEIKQSQRIVGPKGRAFIQAVRQKSQVSTEFADLARAVQLFFRNSSDRSDGRLDVMKLLVEASGAKTEVMENRLLGSGEGDYKTVKVEGGAEVPAFDAYKVFDRFFKRQGYDEGLARHFSTLAVNVALQSQDFQVMITRDKTAGRYYTPDQLLAKMTPVFNDVKRHGMILSSGDMSPIIALSLEHVAGTDPQSLVSHYALATLAHEYTHMLQLESSLTRKPGQRGFADDRVKAWEQMKAFEDTSNEHQKRMMLQTVAEATIPHQILFDAEGKLHDKVARNLHYGATKPNEFATVFSQFTALGFITGTKKVKPSEMFKWMPEEVSMYAKGIYRDLHDNASALAQAIRDPDFGPQIMSKVKDPLIRQQLAARLEDLVSASRDAFVGYDPRATAKQAEAIVNAMDSGAAGGFTEPVTLSLGKEEVSASGEAAIREVQTMLGFDVGGDPSKTSTRPFGKTGQVKVPWFYKRFVPFFQVMNRMRRQGLELADDATNALMGLQPGAARVSTDLLSPMLVKNATGHNVFDPKSVFLKELQNKGATPFRAALDATLKWQQKVGQHALKSAKDGTTLTPAASNALKAKYDRLNPTQRQALMDGVQMVEQVYQNAAKAVVTGFRSKSSYRIAKMLQFHHPEIAWKQTNDLANKIVDEAYVTNAMPTRAGLEGMKPELSAMVEQYLFGEINAIKKIHELEGNFAGRTWFASERRPGSHVVKGSKDGVVHTDGAQNARHAKKLEQEMRDKGFTDVSSWSKNDERGLRRYDAPDRILDKYIEIEEGAFGRYLESNPGNFDADTLKTLRETFEPGGGVRAEMAQRGINSFKAKRKQKPTAFGVDYLDTMRDYVTSLSGSIAKQETRQQMDLILNDSRARNQQDFKTLATEQLQAVMSPTGHEFQNLKSMLSSYYLALNPSSMAVEGTQSLQTLVPVLLDQGSGMRESYGLIGKSIKDVVMFSRKLEQGKITKLEKVADMKRRRGDELTRDETMAWTYRRALNEGVLDHGVIEDFVFGRDQELLLASKFGHGEYGGTSYPQMATDGVYTASKFAMQLYSKVSNFNQKIAFMAGLRQGMDRGLKGTELYDFAQRTKNLSMFGGGKANQPGYIARWSNENTRSTFGVIHTLQQYGFGMLGMYAELASKAFSKDTRLSPKQKIQAKKAFGTMLATQTAFAGAMGLPFVGATLTIIEKLFDVEASQAVREGLYGMLGGDEEDETGFRTLLAEAALNGAGNQFFGVDLSSRLGANNVLGFSEYQGFNLKDLLGPAPSVVENMFKTLNYASTGKPGKAAHAFVPQAFKNGIDLAMTRVKYGDNAFRDKSENMIYNPTNREAFLYATGFRPTNLKQAKQMQNELRQSDERFGRRKSRDRDQVARRMLEGDQQAVQAWVMSQMEADPTMANQRGYESLVNDISQRATSMMHERDALARGASGNEAARLGIVESYPSRVAQRRDEVGELQFRDRLNSMMGLAPSSIDDYSRANILNNMSQQGMTRGQSLQAMRQLGL